jgi:hypothetical protein
MKKIGVFLFILFGLAKNVTAQIKTESLYKKADEPAGLIYSIDNPSISYNNIKIELFKPIKQVISMCPTLELSSTDGENFRSKNGLVSLSTVKYKGVDYIIEIQVDDSKLNDKEVKNYGIILVDGFPVTINHDPIETTDAFNKKTIDMAHQISGYARYGSYRFRLQKVDNELLQIANLNYPKAYVEKLQQKSINFSFRWENDLARHIYKIGFYIDGINPDKKGLEAPRGN